MVRVKLIVMWREHLSKVGLFEPERLVTLVEEARGYAVTHGLVVVAKSPGEYPNRVYHGAFTLLPSPFPRYLFQEAEEVQKDFNVLSHRIAHDFEFLASSLER